MIARAVARFIRISPRKTRLVADMVRGKAIDEAQAILMNLERRARLYIHQLLKSAIANAVNKDPGISLSDLYISKITVDGGPMFKRYKAGSMGRAMMIRHRTSHILIELDLKQQAHKKPVTRVQKPEVEGKSEIKTKTKAKARIKKLVAAKKGK